MIVSRPAAESQRPRPVAPPVRVIEAVLANGEPVELAGVTVITDGAGFEAFGEDGEPLAAHEAFWFAWSQFHPDTLLFEVALG